jgi:L-rhamnose mutarotase
MNQIAFRMILKPGQANEYQRRHETIWPELVELLKRVGVSDYSIWLDETSHHLFAVLRCSNIEALEVLPGQAVMRRWWHYMADVMEVMPDHSPIQIPLQKMFYLE